MCNVLLYIQIFLFYVTNSYAFRRIVGGRNAQSGEFPYICSVGRGWIENQIQYYEHYCTCSFLSPNWGLTAGHCYMPEEPLNTIFYQESSDSNAGNYTKVLNIYLHPGYEVLQENLYPMHKKSDIALLRLQQVSITEYGILSAVDYTTLIGHEVFVAGYGLTNKTNKLKSAISLRKPVQVFKGMVNKCAENDPEMFTRLCVSSPCEHIALICSGDSGGPVIHTSGIIGVNSMGVAECKDFKHLHEHSLALVSSSVLEAVSPVIDWISERMADKTEKTLFV